jgi:putative methylase
LIGSKRELEILLERIEGFSEPKIRLEQYRLPSIVAAEILWYVGLRHGDLQGSTVGDLGCGTGMLTAGAALMGADYVVGVDYDLAALASAKKAVTWLKLTKRVDLIMSRVEDLYMNVDVVVQNPPFGVQVREADRAFLRAGIRSGRTVYSLHKSDEGVRRFIRGYVEGLGAKIDEILPLSIKLPPTYHFHKKKFHEFEADLFRIVRVKD